MQFQTRINDLTVGDVEDKRIAFRVGINIGDVIVEPHDIFGDGVNIAARLESIAEPGGICISASAYDSRARQGRELSSPIWAIRTSRTSPALSELMPRSRTGLLRRYQPVALRRSNHPLFP